MDKLSQIAKLIIAFVLFIGNAKAQIQLIPAVIASAGGYKSDNDLNVSWTLGETFTTPLTSVGLSLSQGFQQNTTICLSVVDYRYVKAGNPFQTLFPLSDGMVISQIPDEVSVLVTDVCSNVTIESFEMNLQGPGFNWNIIQNIEPNALFDNSGNNVFGRNFVPGDYILTVTGYAQDNKGGNITYGPVITRFTVSANNATISTPIPSKAVICAGGSLDITFSSIGDFANGNQFLVQLSSPDGSFEVPTQIGSSSAAGTINCTIPLNMPEGENYLIRIISTNQASASNPTLGQVKINPYNSNYSSPTNDFTNVTVTKQAVNSIKATNKILTSANVNYQAGGSIELNPGFFTQSGTVFKAQIQGCQ
ncbi:MAG: 3-coathanger stack domain-containing protein [Spirosomataceae bacterium]